MTEGRGGSKDYNEQGSAKVRIFCAPLRLFPNIMRVNVCMLGWWLTLALEDPRRSAGGRAPPRYLLVMRYLHSHGKRFWPTSA